MGNIEEQREIEKSGQKEKGFDEQREVYRQRVSRRNKASQCDLAVIHRLLLVRLLNNNHVKSPGSWSSPLCSLQVVWQNLLICAILFYTVYYVVLGMCCVMLGVYELDVLAPFDFKTNPSWLNTNYKVLLVSTEVTYFVCGLLFVLVVEEWVWDYGISVTILHVAITSTGKQTKIKETKCIQSGYCT
ncbi:putative transmembrane protein 244 [Bos indicus]|uniref:Transmembrane protein 244 n=1 Tax=Bos indicus TaxID=9915 RepID=A0ABM4SVA8_BOSIN